MTWYRFDNQNLILQLHVQPGGRLDNIEGIHDNRLKIRVRGRAIENQANDAVRKMLAAEFAVPRTRIKISQGMQNRKKTVVITKPASTPDWFEELRNDK